MILGAALIRGQHLIEGGAYFEIRDFRFQTFTYSGFDRFAGLISLEKEFFGGCWGVARKN